MSIHIEDKETGDLDTTISKHKNIGMKELDLQIGEWYWVSDGKSVFLAVYDPNYNNWTNLDTWEDFYGEVKYVKPIKKPNLWEMIKIGEE